MKNLEFKIQNSKLRISFLFSVFCLLSSVFSGCQSAQRTGKDPFPQVMVGTWEMWMGPEQKWSITFDADGTIPAIHHYVFGPMTAEEGGIYKDGPDAGTYMEAVLGPLAAEYDVKTQKLKAAVTIEAYTMQFVEGVLKGRMIDKLEGAVSADGTTWNVEWRSYGWMEGAAEPPIKLIDKNPVPLTFVKKETDQ